MQEENRPNVQQTPLGDVRQEVRQLATEVARVQEGAEQAQSVAKKARIGVEQNENDLRLHIGRTKALWVLVLLLAVALAGASWYGYPKLTEHAAKIGQLAGMPQLMDAANERIGAAERTLSAMTAETMNAIETERDNFANRTARLERRVAANLRTAQDQLREAVNEVEQRIRTELSQSVEAVQARLAEMESAQDDDRAKLVQLQNDISSVREDLASARREAAEQFAKVREETFRGFSQRDRQLASNKAEIDTVNNFLDRWRIDFELPVHRTQRLTPDVNLTVSQAMVGWQLIDGWLQLVRDGRVLWLRGQGIQQPIVFYTQNDPRPYQIVLTRVKDNQVAGYLLMPHETAVAGVSQSVEAQ